VKLSAYDLVVQCEEPQSNACAWSRTMSSMRDARAIRILTVDDHLLLREGIGAVLEGQPDMALVGQAANGREAIDMFRQLRPDVTLMDLPVRDRRACCGRCAERARNRGASPGCSRKIQQGDCRRAEHLRGDGQDSHEKHPAKARCNRSDPCGDDRPEARNLRPLIRSLSLAG
jgi:CheY-like chemotaxis protein